MQQNKRSWLVILTLPMLSLVSLFGVAHFNSLFINGYVAWITSIALGLLVFSLSFLPVNSIDQRNRALWIAVGICVVEILYNMFSGYLMLFWGDNIEGIPAFVKHIIILIHAVSIPGIFLVVSWFIFHQNDADFDLPKRIQPHINSTPVFPAQKAPRRCPKCKTRVSTRERQNIATLGACSACLSEGLTPENHRLSNVPNKPKILERQADTINQD